MRVEIKHPYSHKLLTERLRLEERGLFLWNQRLTSTDALLVRQAKGNIPSTESRIKELKEIIGLLEEIK